MNDAKIIINADDFGYSHNITNTILSYFRLGYCNSTTVIINCDDYIETYDLAKDAGIVQQVGLHLNLTVGEPLCDRIKACSSFCKNGKFSGYKSNLLKRFALNNEEKSAVETEIRAQIERYLKTGYSGLNMDSHQGIHYDVSIYPIVIKLFKEYGFKRIRRTPNINMDIKRTLLRLPYSFAIRTAGIETTDYLSNFLKLKDSDFKLSNNKTLEIMCHPDHINGMDYIDSVSELLLKDYLYFYQGQNTVWGQSK